MFESVFAQLHQYMDSLETSTIDANQSSSCSNRDQTFIDLSNQVRKSAAMFENVTSKLQPRSH